MAILLGLVAAHSCTYSAKAEIIKQDYIDDWVVIPVLLSELSSISTKVRK